MELSVDDVGRSPGGGEFEPKKPTKIKTYLFIVEGLISMAGIQAQIVSADEDSAAM